MPVLKNIAAIAKGMSITFREMFQPTVVENYPDGPGPLKGAKFQERYRGVHVLQRDENGLEKCVACFLCAAACPSNCIYIEAAENTAENRVSGAERYAKVYNIDYNRCIFCGYCVEACPTDAITHGHGFEIASFNASNLVYRKEQMLAPMPAHMGANAIFNRDEVGGWRTFVTCTGELNFNRFVVRGCRRRSPAGRRLCICSSRWPLVVGRWPFTALRGKRRTDKQRILANDQRRTSQRLVRCQTFSKP